MSTGSPEGQEGLGRSGDPDRPDFTGPAGTGSAGTGPAGTGSGQTDSRETDSPETAAGESANRPRPWPDVPPRATDPGPAPAATQVSARRRTRRRRRGAALVIVLVLLLAALVVGDRLGVHVAERRVGAVLQSQLNTPATPAVSIPDVPFLTQAATGHFGEVRIVATDIPPADKSLALLRLELNLHDVRASGAYRTLQVATVDGTAAFDYAALSSSVGSAVSYGGKDSSGRDQVQVKVGTTIANQTISATLTGPIALDVGAQTITLTDPAIDLAGVQLPAAVSSQLARLFVQPVSVSGLPLGVRLSSLSAGPNGLQAGLTGQNITITTR